MCEWACAGANGLPDPEAEIDRSVERQTSETQWTVCNTYETDRGRVSCKKQCMHCLQPACASACLTKAMHRTAEGPVTWRASKCMGCRFCMVSCPFDVPKFEYDSPVPKIQKCQLCWDRLQEGQQPACVANCPARALMFGPRAALLEEARSRVYQNPDKYVHHIYGEHEVGGTSWLYLSSVPFDQLGFPTEVGSEAYPAYTREFLYAVPLVLTLVPPFLLALNRASRAREVAEVEGGGDE
jgi:Fe-S-cluster-containing dehydrogenase component